MLIWYKITHLISMWILCSVWKMIFPSIRHSFRKRKYVIFLDIGEILKKGVHESSVVIQAYIDFLIYTFLSNSHSKFRRRTNGRIKGRVSTVWGKWERGKDFGKWVTCGKYWRITKGNWKGKKELLNVIENCKKWSKL
jgi:hypothetical protein